MGERGAEDQGRRIDRMGAEEPTAYRLPLLRTAGVALLLAVVAVASRPEGGGGGPLVGTQPARLVLDVVTYLFVAFVLLGLAVVVWALWPRADDELPALPPRRRWALSTLISTLLLAGLAFWLSRAHGVRLGGGPRPNAGSFGTPPNVAGLAGAGAAGRTAFDWVAAGIVVALLAAAAIGAWWLLRPRHRPGGDRTLARLQAVLDDAIEDVLGEGDPRRAVIAAWARLEQLLGRHGVPRRDSEAPFEYAARAGGTIGMETAPPLRRLAGLFEWARFSLHEVTPAMRQEALDGLVAVRDGLTVA